MKKKSFSLRNKKIFLIDVLFFFSLVFILFEWRFAFRFLVSFISLSTYIYVFPLRLPLLSWISCALLSTVSWASLLAVFLVLIRATWKLGPLFYGKVMLKCATNFVNCATAVSIVSCFSVSSWYLIFPMNVAILSFISGYST